MTVQELIARLDTETDSLGSVLKKLMANDTSPVEDIHTAYELLEGGCEAWTIAECETCTDICQAEAWVVSEFTVWTDDFIYLSRKDDDAFLFEVGAVLKVPRHPIATKC